MVICRHPEEALVVEEASGTSGKAKGKAKGKSCAAVDDSVEVYHYIAYVPVDGEVWQLDGLYPHPVSVGRLSIYRSKLIYLVMIQIVNLIF